MRDRIKEMEMMDRSGNREDQMGLREIERLKEVIREMEER